MKKLLNFSADPYDLDKFQQDPKQILDFLAEHQLDGVEMFLYGEWQHIILPREKILGAHARFWPLWLDFWREDTPELLRQFGDKASYEAYYECQSKDEFVVRNRRELEKVAQAGIPYVVFHVSHATIEHCYTRQYSYSDEDVAEAFIDMMNQILRGIEPSFRILMENHWYPGLTFLNHRILKMLMEGIAYPLKGFILDIGHLMNTNLELRDEQSAVDYMEKVLLNLGEELSNIRGIHLNSALSGAYQKRLMSDKTAYDASLSFQQKFIQLYEHIVKIDTHIPFESDCIQKIIHLVKPEYLVYEFATPDKEVLRQMVSKQNKVLGP